LGRNPSEADMPQMLRACRSNLNDPEQTEYALSGKWLELLKEIATRG